ncbi:MAG: hypothetical protein K5751_03840 [Treponemataceae bacterium]|nr:hypothetical protein [Treponemataceae bacterium]
MKRILVINNNFQESPKNQTKKILIYSIIILLLTICSCNSDISNENTSFRFKSSEKIQFNDYSYQKKKLIDDKINQMTLKEKFAQMMLVSVDGTCKSKHISMYTGDYSPGGFLLFKYNVDSDKFQDIRLFTDRLKNSYTSQKQIAPYIAIDHEGGDVNRLKNVMPRLPSQEYIAEHYSIVDSGEIYYLQAKMLEKLGVNVNLAPVNEIETTENHEFLVNRSFGNKRQVYEYGNTEIFNIGRTSVLSVQKHFPGNTNEDTHTGKAVIECDLKTVNDLYIEPFKNVRNKNESAVMMSHTILQSVDSKPSCISKETIKLFKDSTGFNGLIFTDDLTMDALSKSGFPMKKAILEAVKAGVDVIMLSITNYFRIVESVVNDIENERELINNVDRAVKKILEWKIDCGLIDIDLFSDEPALYIDKEFQYSEDLEMNFNNYYTQAERILMEKMY